MVSYDPDKCDGLTPELRAFRANPYLVAAANVITTSWINQFAQGLSAAMEDDPSLFQEMQLDTERERERKAQITRVEGLLSWHYIEGRVIYEAVFRLRLNHLVGEMVGKTMAEEYAKMNDDALSLHLVGRFGRQRFVDVMSEEFDHRW